MSPKKYRPITIGFTDVNRELEVRREIENFLLALNSYPDRFADEPWLTFEQYLCKIMAAESTPDGGPPRIH
ncbi:MAG TPA: hypothetical protein VFB28_04510 [Terriglobales bacterium]|jgi:hypothetical protein|nr:hypothetical protein [Terriglobales bacterium]